MKITKTQITDLAKSIGLEYAHLYSIIKTETPGVGFDKTTGKILIQMEPQWFRRKEPFAPSGLWSMNKVEVQAKEWIAFNDAFKINPDSAMESTSIGMPQILGLHWKRLGYENVGEMWDDFKKGEFNQIAALCRFIKTDPILHGAIVAKNWHLVASIYNGAGYRALAKKYGREPYDITLRRNYDRAAKDINV